MEPILTRSRRRILAALGAVVFAIGVPGAASATVWSPAARLTTSGTPFAALAVGAFAQPDESFLLSGYSNYFSVPTGAGYSTGVAGGVFSPPAGPVLANVAWLPDGSSLVEWNNSMVQHRAANGTFLGSPQLLTDNVNALGADSSGNATAAGVVNNTNYYLNVYTRPFAGSAFTEASTPVATSSSASPMTLVGLVVDPNGAAVITWLAGPTTIYQATRAAGAASFGAPTVVASNAVNAVAPNGVSFASNAAGRAVLVYYDGSGYSAAIRNPGGAFGAPTDITGALTPAVANSTSAVAADGTAATLVAGTTPDPTCGTYYSVHGYQLAPASSSWTATEQVGGASGDSVSHAALAGGPGSRIDAAWSVDTRSSAQECGPTDSYEIEAGTFGGPMAPVFSASPPTYLPGPTTYGNGYTGGFVPKLALNNCGGGALIVGVADASNSDSHDGLFTSTTTGCPAGGGVRPANTAPPRVSGVATVGRRLSASTGTWSGTAPIRYAYQWQRCRPGCSSIAGATSSSHTLSSADSGDKVRVMVTATNSTGSAQAGSAQIGPVGPSVASVTALLRKVLRPTGKLAKLSAIRKHGGYTASFRSLGAGKLTVSWYLVPKGAHLSAIRPVLVANGKASFTRSRKLKLAVRLTRKGKRLLKHAKRIKLTAKGAYTPAKAKVIGTTKSFTLKG